MFLEKEARDLVNAITKTNEFKEFKKAKANIERYKELRDEVELFEKKQMDLYNMHMQGKDAKSLALELNMAFRKLSHIPEVNILLMSGKEFNNMMLRLYQTINDLLDSEF